MRKQTTKTQSTNKKTHAPRSLSLRELQQVNGGEDDWEAPRAITAEDDWETPRAIIAPSIIQKIG